MMVKKDIEITKLNTGNYRGYLHIKIEKNKYYWGVECEWNDEAGWDWHEIPKSLYEECLKYNDNQDT